MRHRGASSVDYECEAEGLFTDVECNSSREFEIDGNALVGDGRVTVTVTNTFVEQAHRSKLNPRSPAEGVRLRVRP